MAFRPFRSDDAFSKTASSPRRLTAMGDDAMMRNEEKRRIRMRHGCRLFGGMERPMNPLWIQLPLPLAIPADPSPQIPESPKKGGFTAEEERDLGFRIRLGVWAERMVQRHTAIDSSVKSRLHAIIEDGRRATAWMVEGNEPLAYALADRFGAADLPRDDARQAALEGIFQAAIRFDPTRRVRFSTYAALWVRRSVQEAIRSTRDIVRLPAYVHENMQMVHACLQRAREHARDGDRLYAVAAQMAQRQIGDTTPYRARIARRLTPSRLRSIDQFLHGGGIAPIDASTSNEDRALSERIVDPRAKTDDSALRNLERSMVREALHRLPETQRRIVVMLAIDDLSESHVAAVLNLSRREVRRMYRSALAHLRALLAPTILDDGERSPHASKRARGERSARCAARAAHRR